MSIYKHDQLHYFCYQGSKYVGKANTYYLLANLLTLKLVMRLSLNMLVAVRAIESEMVANCAFPTLRSNKFYLLYIH